MANYLAKQFASTGKTAHQRNIEGLDEVMGNLNRELEGVAGRAVAGLMAGGLVIQRESMKRTPREYGNLVSSAYTRKAMDDPKAVEVGYTAAYATFVHENLEQKLKGEARPSGLGVYWGPRGEAKFLENAARDKTGEVVRIVARYAKVKP